MEVQSKLGVREWLRVEENGVVAAGSVGWSLGGSTAQDPRQEAQENKCYQDRRVCVSPKKAGIWGQFRTAW